MDRVNNIRESEGEMQGKNRIRENAWGSTRGGSRIRGKSKDEGKN